MIKLNFTEHEAAQDMIEIIKKEKELSTQDAILYAINDKNCKTILSTGWASMALDLWGHGDPDREWSNMAQSDVEVAMTDKNMELITKIMKKEEVDIETAVSYFLIFTMESLGYHI